METDGSRRYRIAARWRWFTALAAPCLVALMAWGAREIVVNYLAGRGTTNPWLVLAVLALLGGMAVMFALSLAWAFRAQVILRDDEMVVRGALLARVIPAGRIEGFRHINDQMHVYLRDWQWPVRLAWFERLHEIGSWVRSRAADLDRLELAEEDAGISRDSTLGLTAAEKERRLGGLRRLIRGLNLLGYSAAAVGFLGFLFVEQAAVTKLSIGMLVLIPILLDFVLFANRGHVRIDHREGSRYPEILSGTLACGVALALMSLLDTGALLNDAWYRWFIPLLLLKGLLWCLLEADQLRRQYARAGAVTLLSIAGLFLIPAFWVGGSLYQLNKQLDRSPIVWQVTEVVDKRVAKGKTASYRIELSPWSEPFEAAVEIKLRREQFRALEVGACVEVGIRQGALQMPWVAVLRRCPERARHTGRDGQSS